MGRPRQFDTDTVVQAARDAFVRGGYRGTSIEDLLQATGVQRASLYSAFGSKRGLLLAALTRPGADLDLVLVALTDLARSDEEVRDIATRALDGLENPALILGRRVLRRAGLDPSTEERE